ncbi:MAG TPA: hypothetical protein VJQ56_03295 [Blastocatellia bacterium]|nr:hypothetical protein [Blastocatellia bacterium]
MVGSKRTKTVDLRPYQVCDAELLDRDRPAGIARVDVAAYVVAAKSGGRTATISTETLSTETLSPHLALPHAVSNRLRKEDHENSSNII